MNSIKQIPDFKDDDEIIEFMESHDGFELADHGFAEIVESPVFSKKYTRQIILNPETLQLIDDLVKAGICADVRDAVSKAVQSYALAVMPDSYKLIRERTGA